MTWELVGKIIACAAVVLGWVSIVVMVEMSAREREEEKRRRRAEIERQAHLAHLKAHFAPKADLRL